MLKNPKKNCFNYYDKNCRGTTNKDCSKCNFFQSAFYFKQRLIETEKWLKNREITEENGKVICRKKV